MCGHYYDQVLSTGPDQSQCGQVLSITVSVWSLLYCFILSTRQWQVQYVVTTPVNIDNEPKKQGQHVVKDTNESLPR